MAKIIADYDTVSKELSVTMDGAAVDNCHSVEIYKDWDDPKKMRCCVTTVADDKESDMRTMTRLVASVDGSLQPEAVTRPDALKAAANITKAFSKK